MPDDIQRDAIAYLRALWPLYPKTLPDLITEPEEVTDDH